MTVATSQITYTRKFCPENTDPFETVAWKLFDAKIGSGDDVVYEQKNVEFPDFFSQNSVDIVASKYFFGPEEHRESSFRQVVNRIAGTIAKWAFVLGYFGEHGFDGACDELVTYGFLDDREYSTENDEHLESAFSSYWAFRDDLAYLILHQYYAFNSPVWFNVGTYNFGESDLDTYATNRQTNKVEKVDPYVRPQCSACFIISLEDNMESILEAAKTEGRLFKYGSGVGKDLSKLRSTKDSLSGGGRPSGPLSFMSIYDRVAGCVKSGGRARRAAKLETMIASHPDILSFINCKPNEENKKRVLQKAGYGKGIDAESTQTVLYQNSNISVRFTDDFFETLKHHGDYELKSPQTGKTLDTIPAYKIWDSLCDATWSCGDPGVMFSSTVNNHNPLKSTHTINSANPCAEFVFIDDSSCNLASLNLCKFLNKSQTFQPDKFRDAVHLSIIAQDVIASFGSYPTEAIAENSEKYRPLGLGFANLGALLMRKGLAYDSESGRNIAGCITSIMSSQAHKTSAELASVHGAYHGWEEHHQLNHLGLVDTYRARAGYLDWKDEFNGENCWELSLHAAENYGLRNTQLTLLAPTGTISFAMGCQTTGIEPDISLVNYKKLAGGGMLEQVSDIVLTALDTLGYTESESQEIFDYVKRHGVVEGCKTLRDEHVQIFDCAFSTKLKDGSDGRSISPEGHVRMMAACQKFLCGAISKTACVPEDTTPKQIGELYLLAHKLGLKSIAVYRNNSKGEQVLYTKGEETDEQSEPKSETFDRRKLPTTRVSKTHRFKVGGVVSFLTVGFYDDGSLGEIWVNVGNPGTPLNVMFASMGQSWSRLLQSGTPFDVLKKANQGTTFEPKGDVTQLPDDTSRCPKSCESIIDYVFQWIELNYEDGKIKEKKEVVETDEKKVDCPKCCLSCMIPSGTCATCLSCGESLGCS